MINTVLFLLLALQVKHWYVDFVIQTTAEVNNKGIYGNIEGIKHSAKHLIGTLLVFLLILGPNYIIPALIACVIDFVTHYHIDWVKMNYGNRDITNIKFWNHLGLDQMMHHLVYLFLVYFLV